MSRRAAVRRSRTVSLFGTAAVLAAAAIATAAPAAAGPTVRYALTQRACTDSPAPGEATCFAVKRVNVPQGTPGARPYTIGSYATGPSGGLTPSDLLTAYGLSGLPAGAGAGQTVAVVDAYDDPNALADLNHFDANYGLPGETLGTTFQVLNQAGATSPLPAADTSGWSAEESLDVDAVRGLCPNCKILLVETNDPSTNDLAAGVKAAVTAGATEVSNSYGIAESALGALSAGDITSLTNAYNYPGVVITASTGDDGWDGWGFYNDGGSSDDSPAYPASSPDVVAVGGTSLLLTTGAARSAEAVWDENGPADSQGFTLGGELGASGGGCSTDFTAQSWQSHIAGFSSTGCGTKRMSGDIAALADPYTGYDIYDSYDAGMGVPGWATYGGTSLASPLVAAMWALAGGAQGVNYPALTLYGHANGVSSPFYDVIKGYNTTSLGGAGLLATGGNDWCSGDSASTCSSATNNEVGNPNPNGLGAGTLSCVFNPAGAALANHSQCTAATGFDGPSGVGAPTGTSVFTPVTPSPSFTPPTGVAPGTATGFTGSASDPFPGGSISSYSWHWGDGSSDSSGAAPSHTFTTAGTYAVKLTVTDSYGQVGAVTHNVTVGTAVPTVTGVSPASGPTAGGTTVTVTGTGFTGATGVKFGGNAATDVVVSSNTSLTAVAPAGASGVVNVRVTNAAGLSAIVSTDQYRYVPPVPAVTAISPSSGTAAGGTTVTITGSGFTGATAVKIGGGAATSVNVLSDTSLTAVSPASTTSGVVNVRVTTPGGTSPIVAADQYRYVPAVSALSPSSGATAGGTTVTITGSGFTGASAVKFGATYASTFTVNSPTQITVTSPSYSTSGVINVRVTNAGAMSAIVAADQYRYLPTVTAVSPSSGPMAGGTKVTITGIGFTGASAVKFGATYASTFTVNSPTQITVTAPAYATTGTINVRVTNAGAMSAIVATDQYRYT